MTQLTPTFSQTLAMPAQMGTSMVSPQLARHLKQSAGALASRQTLSAPGAPGRKTR